MNVSHDAENLQFYLWLRDYKRRFYASSGREQALSPPWDEESLPHPYGMSAEPNLRQSDRTLAKAMDYTFNFDSKDIPLSPISDKQSLMSGNIRGNTVNSAEYANTQTGLKWQACRCSRTHKVTKSNCHSYYSAASFRDQSDNCPLPRTWRSPRAESLSQRSYSLRKLLRISA